MNALEISQSTVPLAGAQALLDEITAASAKANAPDHYRVLRACMELRARVDRMIDLMFEDQQRNETRRAEHAKIKEEARKQTDRLLAEKPQLTISMEEQLAIDQKESARYAEAAKKAAEEAVQLKEKKPMT